MPEFLTLRPPGEALAILLAHLPESRLAPEEIETAQSLGRVTAIDIVAPHSLPAFSRSMVDGFAIRAADTFGASDSLPAYLSIAGEVPMGQTPGFAIRPGHAALIYTGGMLPEGADAVVMVEHTQMTRPGELEVARAVAPNENILQAGEDVLQGEVVVPAETRLRPAEIGGLMALGWIRVVVARRPKIGILSSGDEVVPPQATPQPGQVRDVNSYSLSAFVEEAGGLPVRYGIIPDRADALRAVLSRALEECDAVIVTAGSSASTRDLTAQAIQEAGSPGVLVHGVNVRPGKPTIMAVCAGKAVVGLPGNPVSALVIARLFVSPLIRRLAGLTAEVKGGDVSARLTINLASQAGREEWIPVSLAPGADGDQATPVFFKSNNIFSLVKADGLLYIPADANGLSAGSTILVQRI